MKEADLSGDLQNDGNGEDMPAGDGAEASNGDLARSDYALAEALNLLKGLHILGRRQ